MKNKVRLGVLLAFFGFTSQTMTRDVRDKFGKTELMNYVIDTEEAIEEYKAYISYHELNYYYSGDEDCVEHIERWAEKLRKVRYDIGVNIMKFSNSGININAKDNEGKTALSYCQTKEMYNILRENSAQFQYDVWMQIYRTELSFGTLVTFGAVMYYLNGQGVLTKDTVSAFAKDTYKFLSLMADNIKNKLNVQRDQVEQACKPVVEQISNLIQIGSDYILVGFQVAGGVLLEILLPFDEERYFDENSVRI